MTKFVTNQKSKIKQIHKLNLRITPDQLPVTKIDKLSKVTLGTDGGLEEFDALLRIAEHHVSAALAEDNESFAGRNVVPAFGWFDDEFNVGVTDTEVIV